MDDYISRADAINRLQEIANDYEDARAMDAFYVADYCLKHIMEIRPAADVRPLNRGIWIMHISDLFPADSTMECDQCHEEQPIGIDDNFCPNCGADMGGADNG